MKIRHFIVAIVLLLLPHSLATQHLPIRIFSAKDGLDGGNPLFVDRYGFLWFGSEEGITAYDGTEFTFLGKAYGLQDNVTTAVEDNEGNIWIGGHNGITRASRSTEFPLSLQFTPYSTRKRITEIKVITKSPNGSILISGQFGFYELRNGELKELIIMEKPSGRKASYKLFEFIYNYHFNNILFDSKGTLWLTTRFSIYRCENTKNRISDTLFLSEMFSVEKKFSEWVGAALFDNQDRLWFSTEVGVFVVERSLMVHKFNLHSLGIRKVNSLLYDQNNTLWFGDGDWLHKARIVKDTNTGFSSLRLIQTITPGNGIPAGSTISSLLNDNEGNLWTNTIFGGVMRLSVNGFIALEGSSLGLSSVHKVLDGPAKRLWITSEARVFSIPYDRGSPFVATDYKLKREAEHHLSGKILEFFRLGEDTLIVTDESGQISWMKCSVASPMLQRFHFDLKDQRARLLVQPKTWIVKVYRDRNHTLWLSANSFGVFRCKIKSDTLVVLNMFTQRDGLPDNGIRAITQTYDGTLWFGGFSEGLACYDGSRFRKFTRDDGLSDNYIRSLHETSDSTLWIGTRYNGICAYKEGKFYQYPSYKVLRSSSVWSITSIENDRLWLATGQGLKSFVPDPTFQSQPRVREYDESDGISEEAAFNLHIDREKNLYVSTRKGIYILLHQHMNATSLQPLPFIRSVSVNGKEISFPPDQAEHTTFELAPSDQTLTISFGAIDFSRSGTDLFQYMLEGLTTQWSPPTSERSVTFAKLPPGKYTFKVRSAINLLSIQTRETSPPYASQHEAMIIFTVATPFWRTWWFIGLVGSVIVAMISIVYNYRVEQLLKVERLRGRIATDLHDDIGASLTRIALYSDAALRETKRIAERVPSTDHGQDKLTTMLKEMGSTSRDLIEAMNDIVWSINPKNDSFENLTLRIKDYVAKVLEAAGIEYRIEIPAELSELKLSVEFRRNFFLIFKEALNNVVRHAKATRFDVLVHRDGNFISMTLRDNGTGMDSSVISRGNGLANMQVRAAALNGSCSIASEKGMGTKLSVRLQIP